MQKLDVITLFDDRELERDKFIANGWRDVCDILLAKELGRMNTSLLKVYSAEAGYEYIKLMADQVEKGNIEIQEIIDFLKQLDRSYPYRDSLKLSIMGIRLYGTRRLDFKR